MVFQSVPAKAQEQHANPESIKHPNVLFISLDDMNDWVETLGGHNQSITPNLEQFAATGVNFTHNYTASPGCNPSRSAMLTGLEPHSSGMYSNYQDWRLVPALQNVQTIGQHFRSAGYYTAGAGKIFHYDQVDKDGWDDYYPSITKPMPDDDFPETRPANMPPFKYMYNMFDWGPLDIQDEETGDFETVEYISKQLSSKHDMPFFLAAGIYRPHMPWYVPKKIITRGGNYHQHVVDAGQWKKAVQGYLASIAFADAMVDGHLPHPGGLVQSARKR